MTDNENNEKKPAAGNGAQRNHGYFHRRKPAAKPTEGAPATTETVAQPKPVAQQPKPVAQQPKPVAQQPKSVAQQPKPVVQQPKPVVQQPKTVAQQPKPAVQQQKPVVQQPKPAVQQPKTEQAAAKTAKKAPATTNRNRGRSPKDQPLANKMKNESAAAKGVFNQGNKAVGNTFTGTKLKIIPLGGMNEIGKNMTVFEYGDDIIVVDCGMTFPDEELLGIDLVIPDTSYLLKNRAKIRGIVLTHGHEDHIGALPYVLRDINVPIYCTKLTAGIVGLRLEEHRNLKKVKINVRKDGDHVKLGCFDVEFIHVNHSIPDACAFAIKTPVGVVIHTGDFKIDTTPVCGKVIDLERFGQLGRQGVLLMMCDSTNAERPGMAMSERKVGESFDIHFKGCEKRIIVATFASNVHRIQQIIDVSARYGRKVAVSGRSMENILKVGCELGYISVPPDTMVDLANIKKYPNDKLTIITTGSQGEPMSALSRMAFSGHRNVEVGYGDKILIAATPIPGNEKPVYNMINELFRKGAEVVYERLAEIHVSGHACQEEVKMLLALVKPKYFMPVHGEYRHLIVNATTAKSTGIPAENIFISDLGRVLELWQDGAAFNGNVPCGRVLVDGYGVGDVGSVVLRERKNLSEDGLITVAFSVDMQDGLILSGPEIASRGFIFVREAEDIMNEMGKLATATIEGCFERNVHSRNEVRETVTQKLSDYLYRKTKRSPIIVPLLLE